MARKIKSYFHISSRGRGCGAFRAECTSPATTHITQIAWNLPSACGSEIGIVSPTRNHILHCSINGSAVGTLRAGVFPGNAVRYPRMRFDVDIHSPCKKHRNFSQTYVCSAMQLMTPPPTLVFEITIRAVCCRRLLCHDKPNGFECMTPRVLLVRQSLFSCSTCG